MKSSIIRSGMNNSGLFTVNQKNNVRKQGDTDELNTYQDKVLAVHVELMQHFQLTLCYIFSFPHPHNIKYYKDYLNILTVITK